MKKKGRKTRIVSIDQRMEPGLLHFRLCHVCLYLNESTEEVAACRKCGEAFVPNDASADADEIHLVSSSDPFHDWDGEEKPEEVEMEEEEEEEAPAPQAKNESPRLNGLRVRW